MRKSFKLFQSQNLKIFQKSGNLKRKFEKGSTKRKLGETPSTSGSSGFSRPFWSPRRSFWPIARCWPWLVALFHIKRWGDKEIQLESIRIDFRPLQWLLGYGFACPQVMEVDLGPFEALINLALLFVGQTLRFRVASAMLMDLKESLQFVFIHIFKGMPSYTQWASKKVTQAFELLSVLGFRPTECNEETTHPTNSKNKFVCRVLQDIEGSQCDLQSFAMRWDTISYGESCLCASGKSPWPSRHVVGCWPKTKTPLRSFKWFPMIPWTAVMCVANRFARLETWNFAVGIGS